MPPVSTTGVNEWPAAATRTPMPRSAAARTSAATSSSSRGAAAYAGVKDWLATQFVHRVAAGRSASAIEAMRPTLSQRAPPPRDLEEPLGRGLERGDRARLVGDVGLVGVAGAADHARRVAVGGQQRGGVGEVAQTAGFGPTLDEWLHRVEDLAHPRGVRVGVDRVERQARLEAHGGAGGRRDLLFDVLGAEARDGPHVEPGPRAVGD